METESVKRKILIKDLRSGSIGSELIHGHQSETEGSEEPMADTEDAGHEKQKNRKNEEQAADPEQKSNAGKHAEPKRSSGSRKTQASPAEVVQTEKDSAQNSSGGDPISEEETSAADQEGSESQTSPVSSIPFWKDPAAIRIRITELILLIGIFLIHIWGFWSFDVPIILLDEFAYWEHAAEFAGYDWTGVMTTAPWYSFGYSLLLTPLFSIFENMSSMYHAAILMNGGMAVGIYYTVRQLIRRLYPGCTPALCMAAAAVVSLYSAYIGQSKVAWAEMLIYCIFWLLLWSFYRMLERPGFVICLLTSFLAGMLYIVHNRMLGVVLALWMMAVVLKLSGKLSWTGLQAMILPAVLCYLGNDWIKAGLQEVLREARGLEYGLNNLENRLWKLEAFFTADGLLHGIRSALGELVYVNMATFTFGIIGLWRMCVEIFKKWGNRSMFFLFALLCFLGEWGISTLANMPLSDSISEKLVTYLYYGRYLDGVVGILILTGLLHVLQKPSLRMLIRLVAGNLASFAVTVWIHLYSAGFKQELMKSMCIPGIWYVDRVKGMNIIHFTLIVQAVSLLLIGIFVWMRKKQGARIFFCAAAAGLFLAVGISYSIVRIGSYRMPKEGIFRWAEEHLEERRVYCLREESARYYAQAELYDRKLQLIEKKRIPELAEGVYLITENRLEQENLELCKENGHYFIYQTVRPPDHSP